MGVRVELIRVQNLASSSIFESKQWRAPSQQETREEVGLARDEGVAQGSGVFHPHDKANPLLSRCWVFPRPANILAHIMYTIVTVKQKLPS